MTAFEKQLRSLVQIKEVFTTFSDLIPLEKDSSDMVKSLKLRDINDSLQRELNEGIHKIRSSPTVYVFAGKANDIYEMSKDHRQNLLHDVTKTYQKAPPKLETSINLEAKSISTELKISNRIEHIVRTPVFMTLKDHKDNFRSNPTCRSINPFLKRTSKSE